MYKQYINKKGRDVSSLNVLLQEIEGISLDAEILSAFMIKFKKEEEQISNILIGEKKISFSDNTDKIIAVVKSELDKDERKVNELDELLRDMEITGGKLTTKYISTGDFVYILYEKKRIRRCVYAKTKGRGKYCKIKGDYILLSKLKVV
jgi:chaperonin GroEL (HSP60 family)